VHPRLAELFSYLDTERRALRQTLDAIPEHDRNARPATDRWSVRDILEHLVNVERRVVAAVASAIAQAKDAGLEPEQERSSVVNDADRAKYLDRSRKLSAPPRTHPASSDDAEVLWTALEEVRASLKAAALTGDGLALGRVTQPHPFFGPLSVYEWLALMAGHEARHADQMREVAALVKTPVTE